MQIISFAMIRIPFGFKNTFITLSCNGIITTAYEGNCCNQKPREMSDSVLLEITVEEMHRSCTTKDLSL